MTPKSIRFIWIWIAWVWHSIWNLFKKTKMLEAEIKCLCRKIEIQDLGFSMTHNEVRYIDWDIYQTSQSLEDARNAGAVSIRPVQRYREKKLNQGKFPARKPFPSLIPPISSSSPISTSPVSSGKQEEITITKQELISILEEFKKDIIGSVSSQPNVVYREGVSDNEKSISQEERVFIPSELINPNQRTDSIKIEKAESEGTDIEKATSALKKARRKK